MVGVEICELGFIEIKTKKKQIFRLPGNFKAPTRYYVIVLPAFLNLDPVYRAGKGQTAKVCVDF